MWKPNTNEFEEPDQHWIHVELHKSQGPDLVGFGALKKNMLISPNNSQNNRDSLRSGNSHPVG